MLRTSISVWLLATTWSLEHNVPTWKIQKECQSASAKKCWPSDSNEGWQDFVKNKYMETLTEYQTVKCIQEIYDDRCELLSLMTKLIFTKVNEKVGVCQTTEQQLFSKHLDELYTSKLR